MKPTERISCLLIGMCTLCALAGSHALGAEPSAEFELDPFGVTALRSFRPDSLFEASADQTWNAEELSTQALTTIDDLLDDAPAFSLYRRNSSTVAHPGTQGVSLRNIGPTATSRSLVLLDGLPQNDPFGSWVPWTRFNPLSLESVSLVSAGQSGAWGNIASGGTVILRSRDPFKTVSKISLTVGDNETARAALSTSHELSPTLAVTLNGMFADDGGYPVVPPDVRGGIDEDAFSKSKNFGLHLAWKPSQPWRFEARVEVFDEERGNGTPLARNDSHGRDFSLQLNRSIPAINGSARFDLYLQDRRFYNQFTSLSEDRETEIPAMEQFDVPGRARGAALSIEGTSGEALHWIMARICDRPKAARMRTTETSAMGSPVCGAPAANRIFPECMENSNTR